MERLFTAILILMALVFLACQADAAGSVTQAIKSYPNGNMKAVTFSWTGDAANGTVPSTATNAAITTEISGWYVYAIETDPGSVAPTTLYDIVINDASGFDIAGGQLANRSATATERVIPKLDATASLYGGSLVDGALTLVITGQSVVSATGTVKLLLSK